MAHEHDVPYENNPFYIGLNGLKSLFVRAQSVAIYAVVLSVAYFLINGIANIIDIANSTTMNESQVRMRDDRDAKVVADFFAQDPGRIAVAGVIGASAVFLFIVVVMWLYGALEYTGARLAKGETVELKTALKETGKELASYIWLYVVVTVKLILWTLLFIVPGFIMAVRYSLAGTVFFAEGKRGNAAVKRSAELTKGAWFTTYSGIQLWNIITLGVMQWVLQPGVNAVLYSQLSKVTDAGHTKPAAHWLSWLTFFVPLVLFLIFVVPIMLLIIVFSTGSFGP